MTCVNCGHNPPAGSPFCNGCGAKLEITCARCGATPPPESRFCNGCGSPLGATAVAAEAVERNPRDYTPKHLADRILQSKSVLEGERKHVTVMFADVKGSMELAEQVGAEQWHTLLDRFFAILAEGVHRFEGTVNQYTGDGIMALFGAPISHEDHAQRACFAALHLRSELRKYADELRRTEGISLSARIGLNSGEVIVGKIGDDLRMDYTAQGHTVGLAQRMESRAAADSTYLTEHTARLVEGYFDLRDLGEFDLKGANEPLQVFELEGVGKLRTRLDRSRARGFAKFVGRDREMASLDNALAEAIAGNGQVVGVVAEAGTGKSRLCAEFVEHCRARGIQVNDAHCPAHGKTVPNLPLLEILRSIFEIEESDSDHEVRRKITGELMLLDEKFHGMLPFLFEFLGVPDPAHPAPAMSPEGRQQQLFGFIRHLQQARSEREPTVILLDDLHWIDPGSDAFLAHAVDATQGHRTLMLVNFRPEYHADWMSKSYYRQIPLQPLGREAIELLLDDLIGTDPSLASLPERVFERTGGNPFFVEEVVQSLIETGRLSGQRGAYRLLEPTTTLEIPATVHSVLAARVDRLPEREKRLLQTASVIQKEFAESILEQVARLPEEDLAEGLAALIQGEFLLQRALYPEREYAFKHPLTQEVAYRSLLGERRAQLHGSVARAIEAMHEDKLGEHAALLAYHWEQAGDKPTAARWHARAAEAAGFDSPTEAVGHWERVSELLHGDRSDDLAPLRLQAISALVNFGWRLGMTDERVVQAFNEGKALAIEAGDARAQVLLHYGLATNYSTDDDPERALPIQEAGLAVADASGDPELRWSARETYEWALWRVGNLDAAMQVSDEQMALHETDPRLGIETVGFSTANSFSHRGQFLGDIGCFAEAEAAFRRCEELAGEFGENEQLSWNDLFHAHVLVTAGDARAAASVARRAVESCDKIGSNVARVGAHGVLGEALALNADWEPARSSLEFSVNLGRDERVGRYFEPRFLATLAEVQLRFGDVDRAREIASEAVEIAVRTGRRVDEARALLARIRVLSSSGSLDKDRAEIEATIERAQAVLTATGAHAYDPQLLEVRAEFALAIGDDATHARLRDEALDLYSELGAVGHATRLADQRAQ